MYEGGGGEKSCVSLDAFCLLLALHICRTFLVLSLLFLSYSLFPSSQAVTRTRLLDYFTARRRATRDDHVLFAFEQSMALGPNEQTFLTQLCLQVLMKQQTVLSRIFFPLWTRGFSLFVSSNSHFA